MSDTPITDANVCITTKEGCETIAPDICRKFERENAAMREAIREAHATLEDWGLLWKEQAGLVSSRSFSDGSSVSKASTAALSKLQPFLKP